MRSEPINGERLRAKMSPEALERSLSLLKEDEVTNGRVIISRTTWLLRIATVSVVIGLALWYIVSSLGMDDLVWNIISGLTIEDLWKTISSLTMEDFWNSGLTIEDLWKTISSLTMEDFWNIVPRLTMEDFWNSGLTIEDLWKTISSLTMEDFWNSGLTMEDLSHRIVGIIQYLGLLGGIILIHTAVVLVCAWTMYKNPAKRRKESYGIYKVAVIIPIYNQVTMIEKVVEAIYRSTYKRIEVIGVNDGSTDGTKDALDQLKSRYSDLVVLHKKNSGKRRAVASGFRLTKADIIVLVDSDSIVHPEAIEEFVKTFESDKKIGAVVGDARALNGGNNFLTKCQDAWYDYSFNVHKACESYFSNVTCCSGCLAGYRREAIESFIDAWSESGIKDNNDPLLTKILPAGNKSWLARTTLRNAAAFDDSEDRILTTQSLQKWKASYVASALVYTEVPETARKYFRQQIRWKKGYIRSNVFASTFMWRRNLLLSFIFYLDFLMTFAVPFIVIYNVIYQPLIYSDYLSALTFTSGIVLLGLVQGLDHRARVPNKNTWKYKPLTVMITTFINIWLVVPAIIMMRKNVWGTR